MSLSEHLRPLPDPLPPNLREAVQAFERTLIHATLVACDWNQRKAAQTLGVLPTTLSEKIRRFDLRPRGVRGARTRPRALVPAIGVLNEVNDGCPSCGQEAPRGNGWSRARAAS